ncbi:hypothetical protein MTO96_026425 [Rhipicephalus appendiculatus]
MRLRFFRHVLPAHNDMDSWTYTLTGFGDFLEMRSVSFAEPMPAGRVCGVCGVLPSRVLVLPCKHVLCHLCYSHVGGSSEYCPVDGRKLGCLALVYTIAFKLSQLEQSLVFCAAAGDGVCGFVGRLSELKDHLAQCGGGEVQAAIVYRRLSEGGAKSFVEPVTAEAWNGHGGGDEQQNSPNPTTESKELAPVIPGPLRAASGPGVLITTCEFTDVYAFDESPNEDIKERRISSATYTLGGYTFRLDCEFSRDEREACYVRFILFLRDGEWDSYVEWPFSKNVTLIVMHSQGRREGHSPPAGHV